MHRVLVTGGAGFLGSHLCERLLDDGHEVIALDNLYTGSRSNLAHLRERPGFELLLRDVAEPLFIEVDRIYHMACPASPVHYQRNPVQTIHTAVVGTFSVLELARRTGARLLFASTSEIYGDPGVHPQVERYWGSVNPVGERACYDEGKRCGEALVISYVRQHGVEARIARIFNTYGPRMHEHDGRVIPSFIMQALRGQPLTIYGAGTQTRSFCYFSDLLEGLVRLMEHERDPGPVNLGNPDEMCVARLAELILELSESSSRVIRMALPSDDPRRRCPDISKAHVLLGWGPRVPITDGLATTIDYFQHSLSARAHAVCERGHADAAPAAG